MNKLRNLLMALALGSGIAGCSQTSSSFRTLSPQAFSQELKGDASGYILDVRTPQEFAEGHLPEAHNLDWLNQADFQEGVAQIPKEATIYVYCRSGRRSAGASKALAAEGFKVVNLRGGFSDIAGKF